MGAIGISNTSEALVQCINQLDVLLQDNNSREMDEGWPVLLRALKGISAKWDGYAGNITVAECFLGFFSENVRQLAICLDDKSGRGGILDCLCDVMFALTEDAAVLMREYALRTGYTGMNQDELDFMDYFDASGRWFLGDGTMVSEYYYVRVPVRVIAEYARLGGKLAARQAG